MSTTVAPRSVAGWRKAVCLLVALGAALMCATFLDSATPTAGSPMQHIGGPTSKATQSGMGFDGVIAVSASVVPGLPMEMACDGVCAMETQQACAAMVALASVSLLALVLALRRHTLLGLTPRRQMQKAALPVLRVTPPWTVLSPLRLCVMRV